MVGWHHQLDGHEFEQAPGDGKGQGSLVCCSPWGHKESDTTEWLNNSNPETHWFKKHLFWTSLQDTHPPPGRASKFPGKTNVSTIMWTLREEEISQGPLACVLAKGRMSVIWSHVPVTHHSEGVVGKGSRRNPEPHLPKNLMVIPHCSFDLHFLIMSDVEHLSSIYWSMNLFTEKEWRSRCREQTCRHIRGRRG